MKSNVKSSTKNSTKNSIKSSMNVKLREWCRVFIEAAVILGVLYMLMWPVGINGNSMENTLKNNDNVVISRLSAMLSWYTRGDLIVFDWVDEGKSIDVVKRVIALEGDNVEIKDGDVFINGRVLEEPYALGETYDELSMTVPEEHVFVLGDNREHSTDSRYMGAIPKSSLVGKVVFRWYPFNAMRGF